VAWSRNGYWANGTYGNWSGWTATNLAQIVPGAGSSQAYRGMDQVVLADGRVKQTLLTIDGTRSWSRYGTWSGTAYDAWTDWTDQYGNLTQAIPGQGTNQAWRSIDHVALPDGRLVVSLLAFDGKKVWHRIGTWTGASYGTWTSWSDEGGELSQLIPGQGTGQSFRSFDQEVFVDDTLKQTVVAEDGSKAWYRRGTWDGAAYGSWTAWTDQYGNLSQMVPGQGTAQAWLSFDHAALEGDVPPAGCPNGCDDADPCTLDVCENSVCRHDPKSCDDGNACTSDACVAGACQHSAADCDDGNACTDDWCSGGCQHANNTASCAGGQCKDGTCQASCTCMGCEDSCGKPCNEGAVCASEAVCKAGVCACKNVYCGGSCCAAGESCDAGVCCGSYESRCAGRCGSIQDKCGKLDCGGCSVGQVCCSGYCDDFCN